MFGIIIALLRAGKTVSQINSELHQNFPQKKEEDNITYYYYYLAYYLSVGKSGSVDSVDNVIGCVDENSLHSHSRELQLAHSLFDWCCCSE